ncbi:hypothetical protein FAI40_06295 [Acetobacteraceae bacterium]|nr:hypothetical protein FAI40_06150 [Acetobacteraceae bacterium]QCE35766.1 hypothetical protein FAI40_06295 [Acetobacteraceae bacterium]
MHRIVGIISRISFGVASIVLILLAYVLLYYGIRDLYLFLMNDTAHHDDIKNLILRTVSYVVVAIAVFDVAKFFIEDEVIKDSDKLSEWQIRNSLSKFITTVIIAVFVEGLVGIFEEGVGGGINVLYPASLLVVGSLIVFIMGVYQKMTRNVLLAERKRTQIQRIRTAHDHSDHTEE